MKKIFSSELTSTTEGIAELIDGDDANPHDLLLKAVEYHNNFRTKEAISCLEVLMDRFPRFSKGRIIFSMVYEKNGKNEKACNVLERGIENFDEEMPALEKVAQYQLCLSLAKIRFKQYQFYSLFKEKKMDKPKYKRSECLDFAHKYCFGALEFCPDKIGGIELMAFIYEEEGDFEKASIQLSKLQGKGTKYMHSYARICELLGKREEMMKTLNSIIKETPHDALAYERLAEHTVDKEERVELQRKQKFYTWLPKFCAKYVPYDSDTFTKFYNIVNKNRPTLIVEKEDYFVNYQKTMASLLKDDETIESTCLLIAVVCNHDYGADTAFCFKRIRERAMEDEKVLEVLYECICSERPRSSCVKHFGKILALKKHEKTFSKLIQMMIFDSSLFDMGIPESLAIFGKKKAIPHLIRGMSIGFRGKTRLKMMSGTGSSGHLRFRQRCCLALGCFKDKEAYDALKRGLKNRNLKKHCAVGLYKMTQKEKYIKKLKTNMKNGMYYGQDIILFLKSKCHSIESAKEVLDLIEKTDAKRVRTELKRGALIGLWRPDLLKRTLPGSILQKL